MAICYIVGAGDCREEFAPKAEDLLIAADGGYRHLAERGLTPDLMLGDFDSFTDALPSCPILRFPAEKDDTDTALAIEEGVWRGYREFRIYGALGGERIDHSVAMFSTLLSCARRGLSVSLFGGGRVLFTLKNGEYRFPEGCAGYLSVFAFGGDAKGVSLSGVKYPLQDATLTPDRPLGVSNEFLADGTATVRVDDGILLLICEQF